MAKVVEERIRVRYGETDAMGHAYYANYLYWFEQARGAWCRATGFSYREIEAQGIKLPVVEAHVEYKAEVLYDEEVIVRIWCEEIRRASVRFAYEVINAETLKRCTTGYTVHVVMGENRKAISIPDHLRKLWEGEPTPA